MPKSKPDRDDARGNMAGQGGPQDGKVEQGEAPARGPLGTGGQRHEGGSSRDSQKLGEES